MVHTKTARPPDIVLRVFNFLLQRAHDLTVGYAMLNFPCHIDLTAKSWQADSWTSDDSAATRDHPADEGHGGQGAGPATNPLLPSVSGFPRATSTLILSAAN